MLNARDKILISLTALLQAVYGAVFYLPYVCVENSYRGWRKRPV